MLAKIWQGVDMCFDNSHLHMYDTARFGTVKSTAMQKLYIHSLFHAPTHKHAYIHK